MSPRLSAPERLQRLLAIVPWVNGRGGASLDEIALRFDYPKAVLQRDLLNVVPFVGAYPYTPDEIIEIDVDPEDEWVTIRYNQYFRQPLRLTTQQAVALIGAANGLAATHGLDDGGGHNPLQRALDKLAGHLGIEARTALDVRFDDVDADLLTILREAIADRRQLLITYYSLGRDVYTERTVEPYSLWTRDGHWYLSAFCRNADGPRLFRVDRIENALPTGATFVADATIDTSLFEAPDELPQVVLDVSADGRWVVDFYPAVTAEDLDDGWTRVTMAVSGGPFLERLLLQLGPRARVHRIDPPFVATIGSDAAATVRERYRGDATTPRS